MNSVTENRQDETNAGGTGGESGADVIDRLRRFHYGEPAACAETTRPSGEILPALLNPYRDATAIRYQYPLYLVPPGDTTETELATSASEYLVKSLQALAPGEDEGRILKDNLAWIERFLRTELDATEPVDAPALFARAATGLQEHLGLDAANREQLAANLERLADALAAGSQFLGYGPNVSLHLMMHAIKHRRGRRLEQFSQQVDERRQALESMLEVEKAKSGDARKPSNLTGSVGPSSRYLDAGALSGMLDQRAQGSVAMSAERRARIERALQDLEAWQPDPVAVCFVGRLEDPYFSAQPGVQVIDSDEPCVTAGEVFERDADRLARLFAAARIAALEIEDRYDPGIHDSWFAGFDWQAFSDDEMRLVTPVVALVSADYLAGDGLASFSRLLGSRLPVHVMSWVRAYDNPGAGAGEGPFDAYRFELAYFGIGHRQVIVAQTSAARHDDLLAGFVAAIDSNRTSLHLINRGTQTQSKQPLLDAWFVASAALEGRAHPFILVNPDAGDHAAERVSFAGNPQADRDWPVEKLEYRGADGEVTEMDLAFTFADYALLMPTLHDHFRTVPPGFESEDLLTIDQYLELDEKAVERRVPFIWGIDDQGVLLRLVVSRALVFACRDRLNYWRTLQELAGIHNSYVEEAIERVIEEQRASDALEREKLQKAHEEELQQVRSEAAGDAMGQLVDVLMGADLSGLAGGGAALATMPAETPAVPETPEEPAAKQPAEPEEEEDEALSFDEPWLDTAMCTTCDDCMGVNKMMFAYNENKQAILKDPRAGTFADLVKAAEICPAKCIHPGKPLDPNEPGLEELVARAAPFN